MATAIEQIEQSILDNNFDMFKSLLELYPNNKSHVVELHDSLSRIINKKTEFYIKYLIENDYIDFYDLHKAFFIVIVKCSLNLVRYFSELPKFKSVIKVGFYNWRFHVIEEDPCDNLKFLCSKFSIHMRKYISDMFKIAAKFGNLKFCEFIEEFYCLDNMSTYIKYIYPISHFNNHIHIDKWCKSLIKQGWNYDFDYLLYSITQKSLNDECLKIFELYQTHVMLIPKMFIAAMKNRRDISEYLYSKYPDIINNYDYK